MADAEQGSIAHTKTCRQRFLYAVIVSLSIVVISLIIVLVRKPSHDVAAHRGPPCPRYWNWYEGNCYYFSKEEKDWSSSQKFCAANNASLARIESEDMDFVMKYKGKSSYWIGLRREKGQPWKWINGDNSVLQVIGDGGNCAYLNDEGEATASSSM